MFNQSGITNNKMSAATQILANVELQMSVGCVVTNALAVTVGSRKIVKAGTPVKIDYNNLSVAPAVDGGTNGYNAIILHDVDVTDGNQNATALIFGFVNLNRIDTTTTLAKLTAQTNNSKVVLLKL